MRFDIPIFFQQVTRGDYDSTTGNYGEDTIDETKKYARVTNASVETLNLIYGELKQDSYVVRLQNHYDEPFSYIRIGRRRYRVDYSRKQKVKHIFVISEVQ